ncbi:MAG: LPS export ABC transporter periplasmic protein LptC [Saprospiraceae bacterium]|nr:LPS export ABC transporter periplasmic protein LptC [Saprospiraceae bacterium]MCZ2340057.1 LPS export ABC transporter periplasmic protein LptC [Chitinophagales bacterium]
MRQTYIIKNLIKGLLGMVILLALSLKVVAQTKISIHSEDNQIIDAREDPPTQFLNGNVRIYHAHTFMYCDTAVLRGNVLRMRNNVSFIQNDTIRIFADSAKYNGDSLIAYLYGNIILENGFNRKLYTTSLKYDVGRKIAYYNDNARMEDKGSSLISRRGRYVLNDKTAYFYENVKVLGDQFELITDSLAYNTETQIAHYLAPVQITKDSALIYSENGWFNLGIQEGEFTGNAQYIEGNTIAHADTIRYEGEHDIVRLISGKTLSTYTSDQDTASAQIIAYDRKNETYTLNGNAHYKNKTNEVKGVDIFYDKKNEKFKVVGRSEVSDPPMIIKADTLDYDKTIQYGKADGNVIWMDTSAQTTIVADHVLYHGNTNDMLVTNDIGRPLFITVMDHDSLYMKADTFKSFRVIRERIILPDRRSGRSQQVERDTAVVSKDTLQMNDTPKSDMDSLTQADSIASRINSDTIYTGIMDTMDYFVGYHTVRIFKSDMQAVCDSLVFSKFDSTFTLMRSPFLWSDSTQINGDTITLTLKDKKIDHLSAFRNGTILSTEDNLFFDQIQGRALLIRFEDSKMKSMDVSGDAKMVFYLKDEDKAYIGVNVTEASTMKFDFKDKKVTDIKNYKEPRSTVFPMRTAAHETLKIKGFKWNQSQRPKSKDDI